MTSLELLKRYLLELKESGEISRDDVSKIEVVVPNLITEKLPITSFTDYKSNLNYTETISIIESYLEEKKDELDSNKVILDIKEKIKQISNYIKMIDDYLEANYKQDINLNLELLSYYKNKIVYDLKNEPISTIYNKIENLVIYKDDLRVLIDNMKKQESYIVDDLDRPIYDAYKDLHNIINKIFIKYHEHNSDKVYEDMILKYTLEELLNIKKTLIKLLDKNILRSIKFVIELSRSIAVQ